MKDTDSRSGGEFNEEYELRQRTRFTVMLTNVFRAELDDPIEVSAHAWEEGV